jgi:outer membrane protein TolC
MTWRKGNLRNLSIGTIFVSCNLLLFSEIAFATEKKITQKEVIESSVKFYPQILSSYEKVKASEGSYLASQGFFDIKLEQKYQDKTRGYYNGKTYDVTLEKELGVMGSKIYGGYRKSYGDFAGYDGDKLTNGDGEYRIGGKVSLLKNRGIDSNRLSVLLSSLGVEESKIQLELIKKVIERDATKAYWGWVAAGEIYKIYDDLYQLSLRRQGQLEQRLAKGDVAQIIVEENKKNVLRRKTSLIQAKQDFENSALALSLYLRKEDGTPILADRKHLPHLDFAKLASHLNLSKDVEHALSNRPEIKIIEIKNKENQAQSKYANNLLQPELDVEFGASKDQGKGPVTRSQSENFANLNFSLPLQFSEARGKIAEYDSKLKSIAYERQLLRETIAAEIEQIFIRIRSLGEIHENIKQEVSLAELLESSEREKFKHGASNFFLVNLREQDTALSKAMKAETVEKYYGALADYHLATFIPNQ